MIKFKINKTASHSKYKPKTKMTRGQNAISENGTPKILFFFIHNLIKKIFLRKKFIEISYLCTVFLLK